MRALLLFLSLGTVACNTALDHPGDLGSCSSATTAEACNAMTGCVLDACGGSFACLPPGTNVDPCSTEDDCSFAEDTASCNEIPGCTAQTCPTGCTSSSTFVACAPTGAHAPLCPAPTPCHPLACDELTDAQSCASRPDCHSLYVENDACDCDSVFCCATFSTCADGATTCVPPGPVETPPYSCGGTTYVYSYDPQGAVDGCTLASECPS